MATNRSRKPQSRKRPATRKKKSVSRATGGLSLSKILLFLALIAFFFISIGVAGYVIFFRVVVAAELTPDLTTPQFSSVVSEHDRTRSMSGSWVAGEHTLTGYFLVWPGTAADGNWLHQVNPPSEPGNHFTFAMRDWTWSGENG